MPKLKKLDISVTLQISKRLIESDEAKYEGEVYKGKRHGKGKLESKIGYKYEGYFEKDEFNGQGTLITPSQSRFCGEWKKGLLDGFGIEEWS